MTEENAPEPSRKVKLGVRVAFGCFTAFLGFFSGGMVAVLIGRIVAYVVHAQACPDIPSCDWYVYLLVGGALGFVTLPVLVLRVLGKPAKGGKSDRGM